MTEWWKDPRALEYLIPIKEDLLKIRQEYPGVGRAVNEAVLASHAKVKEGFSSQVQDWPVKMVDQKEGPDTPFSKRTSTRANQTTVSATTTGATQTNVRPSATSGTQTTQRPTATRATQTDPQPTGLLKRPKQVQFAAESRHGPSASRIPSRITTPYARPRPSDPPGVRPNAPQHHAPTRHPDDHSPRPLMKHAPHGACWCCHHYGHHHRECPRPNMDRTPYCYGCGLAGVRRDGCPYCCGEWDEEYPRQTSPPPSHDEDEYYEHAFTWTHADGTRYAP